MQWLREIAASALARMSIDASRLPAGLASTGAMVVRHEQILLTFAEFDWIVFNGILKAVKTAAKYKAVFVTLPIEMEKALQEACRSEIRKKSEVVQEALRLYFRARGGKMEPRSLVVPTSVQDREHTELSAFAPEWSSSLDSVYDSLGRKQISSVGRGDVEVSKRRSRHAK